MSNIHHMPPLRGAGRDVFAEWLGRLPATGEAMTLEVDGMPLEARRSGQGIALLARLGAAPEQEGELRRLMRRALGVAEAAGGSFAIDATGRLVLHAPAVRDAAGIAAFCDAVAGWRAALLQALPTGGPMAAQVFIRP